MIIILKWFVLLIYCIKILCVVALQGKPRGEANYGIEDFISAVVGLVLLWLIGAFQGIL